jgi:hypothetical protein
MGRGQSEKAAAAGAAAGELTLAVEAAAAVAAAAAAAAAAGRGGSGALGSGGSEAWDSARRSYRLEGRAAGQRQRTTDRERQGGTKQPPVLASCLGPRWV